MASSQPKHHDPRPLVEREISKPQSQFAQKSTASRARNDRPRRTVTVNLAESPLAWLHVRSMISDRQLLAGEKLRGDYERAKLGPRVTMQWDAAPIARTKRASPPVLQQGEAVLSAKRRFDDAMIVLGRDLNDISWRVICAGEGVPAAEKAMGWPNRSGKLVLRIALDRLADHYRLPG